jgi:hypothetical protein
MPTLLAIYLNDHLAGATGGVELARRVARAEESAELNRLADDIEEDRATLAAVMRRLDVRIDPVKVAAGWLGEKAARLKLNGRLLTRSPLSTLIELEAMRLGVEGKAAGWRTLRTIAARDQRLDTAEFDRLIERADQQVEALEEMRVAAAQLLAGANQH